MAKEIGFRKTGAEVQLHGQCDVVTSEPVLVLPVGARPEREQRFAVTREDGVGSAIVTVHGRVQVDPDLGSGWVDLSTIRFITK